MKNIEGFELIENTSKIFYNGSRWETTKYGTLTIIGRTNRYSMSNGYKKYNFYLCQFDDGYITEAVSSCIKLGEVRNPYAPTLVGVGYRGEGEWNFYKNNKPTKEYSLYYGILERCYNPKCPTYESYGGDGVTVCERWHNFQNFCNDIKKLQNYDKWINDESQKWEIDKDFLCSYYNKSQKIYSPEVCIFIPKRINITEQNKRTKITGNIYLCNYNNNEIVFNNVALFCRQQKLPSHRIYNAIKNNEKYENYSFRLLKQDEYIKYQKQIDCLLFDQEIYNEFLKYVNIDLL